MSRHPGLAISLYVAGRTALIVGDGPAAEERARRLTDAGARVTRVTGTDYAPARCAGVALVLAVTGDPAVDAAVAADARAAGALAYAVDQPERSDFALPALARRGPLAVAISSDGTAPALARRLRQQLQALLDGGGAALDGLLARLRRRRGELPGGPARTEELRALAAALRLEGRLVVEDGEEEEAAEAGEP